MLIFLEFVSNSKQLCVATSNVYLSTGVGTALRCSVPSAFLPTSLSLFLAILLYMYFSLYQKCKRLGEGKGKGRQGEVEIFNK